MKHRKKIFLIIIALLLSSNVFAVKGTKNYSYSVYYGGYWGDWTSNSESSNYIIRGKYNEFFEGRAYDHPSEYFWKLTIDNLINCSRRERDMKDWNEYTGTLEYFVSEEYPTLKSILKTGNLRVYGNVVKKTIKVKVRIKPYKLDPQLYNIWFVSEGETCGFAIYLRDGYPFVLDW